MTSSKGEQKQNRWIAEGRIRRGKTQQQLADMLTIPLSVVQALESDTDDWWWWTATAGLDTKIMQTFEAWDEVI